MDSINAQKFVTTLLVSLLITSCKTDNRDAGRLLELEKQ